MRKLIDLISVGKETIKDFKLLGIKNVEDLINRNAEDLYHQLCEQTHTKHDICCLDIFRAAIEQAKNPNLEREKCNWWYWSKQRKLNDHLDYR